MPGAIEATTVPASSVKPKKARASKVKIEDDASDYDATPPPTKRPATNGKGKKPAKKKVKVESDDEADDESPPPKKAPSRKRKVKEESDEDEDEKPLKRKAAPKKAAASKVKKEETDSKDVKPKRGKAKKEEPDSPKKKTKKEKEEEEAEAVYRWWEQQNQDNTVKWTTLEHSGVIFPPPYEPLPKDVKMNYKGKPVQLSLEAEEVAGFYAALLESDHAQDATFNKNFFHDWQEVLEKHPPVDGTKITKLSDCDFRPMFEYFEAEKAKKKAMTQAEKKAAKAEKEEAEAKYKFCLLDGRKEQVGNFRVEPPGLFRGRGDHPRKGALKHRVRPEDITLNIGKSAPVPVPNMAGKWKGVQHDQTVTWLATWTENVNQNHKYVFLAAGSSLKGQSDMQKFEKARELKNHVDRIRSNYEADLRSKVMAERQRATAMYFIDKLALRAGNEKGEDEADTVGCCSLRCEHVTLENDKGQYFITFDFLGKDSIRYYNRVEVEQQIFKNVRIFKDNKNDDDNVFDRVNTTSLNKHLTNEMKGLTAKVFRTYNASITFQRLLDESGPSLKNATLQEKLNAYNDANRMVAVLCNHQRSVPKTFEQSMEKMRRKVLGLKYDRMKLRHALFNLDAKNKKNKKYNEMESDIDEDFVVSWEEECKATDIEKAEKKFAKENEKLAEEGKSAQADKVLKERIKDIEDRYKVLAKERGTQKADPGKKTEQKIMENIDKLDQRIKQTKLQITDKDAGKEIALGTSKINYLDPRITASWAKIHDVPISKMFSRTLVTKFPWAMEVDEDWKF
ncbi:hypothetical protein BD626DRAFT_393380 [Schizophyllum amplum]|uniref:DNA topoisomerase I n=1 Tax=Schizophyllum amplum TaxID=97359 RepID=A0A550CYR8_9AGAR|nr:hypothetical protein BD626DRAFT_393380 [Auriculariopsis ampla]